MVHGVAPREVVKLTLKEQSDYQPMFSYLAPDPGYLITFPRQPLKDDFVLSSADRRDPSNGWALQE